MKKSLYCLLIVFAVNILLAGTIEHRTLDNGMELIVKENNLNSSVAFYCFVKTGSLNEGKYLGAGISHYLEHVVSGGTTEMRTEAEYVEIGKEIGSIVNAYTSSLVTAYHITLDKKYQDIALEMMKEHLFYCSFAETEVAREREVILKEIVMRSTPPFAKIRQRNNELVYPRSNKKYPVIGYTDLYKTITREQLMDYYHKRYAPNNMIFVTVGDINTSEMMDKLVITFKDLERKQIEPEYQPSQTIRAGSIEYVEEFEIQQPLVMMTTIIPSNNYQDLPALDTALGILFSRRQSPIRYNLVEELQSVNFVDAYTEGYMPFPEGEILINFEAKKSAELKNIVHIIDSEIDKYSRGGFTQEDLNNEINRIKAKMLLSTPGVDGECNRIGWSMLFLGIPDRMEHLVEILEELTPEDLSEALRKHLLPKNRVILYALPQGDKVIFEESETTDITKTDPQKIILSDKLTLIYRQNDEKPLIRGVIWMPIKIEYETVETAGNIQFMLDLMFRGSKKYKPLEISEWLEDHAVYFDVDVSYQGTFIEFKCLKADYEELSKMLFDAFKNAKFPQKELELAQQNAEANFMRSRSNAYSLHNDFLKSVLYQEKRDKLSSEQRLANVQNLERDDLLQLKEEFFRAEKLIVTLYGDLSEEEAGNKAHEIRKQIPASKIEQEITPLTIKSDNTTHRNEYGFEQVNLNINYPAPSLSDQDYFTMRVISVILQGARGRIYKATRGVNDLAYFAYPEFFVGQNSGYLRLTSQTSNDKTEELIAVLVAEIQRLQEEKISREELDLALDEMKKIYLSYINDNKLPYYLTYYEAIGLGYDFIFNGTDILKKVTPEDIQRVASEYLQSPTIIISEPNENVQMMVN